MVKKKLFLKGVLALTLIFGAFLAACSNDTYPTVLSIIPPNVGGPVVTAKAINVGVLLTWPQVIQTAQYEIYRTTAGQASPKFLGQIDGKNGTEQVVNWLDTVNSHNTLSPNTIYTYSVVAIPDSPAKDSGRTDVLVTTGPLLPAGSKAVQPADVDLAINYGTESVTITITPPASGNIPNHYMISDGGFSWPDNELWYDGSAASLTRTITPGHGPGSFVSDYTGDLTVTVYASLDWGSTYYESADPYVLKKSVARLFGDSSPLPLVEEQYTYKSNSGYSISGFGTAIRLYNDLVVLQPGVTYTLERAKQTNAPNANWAWTTPALYKRASGSSDTAINLTENIDIFGNIWSIGQVPGDPEYVTDIVYDRGIPVEEGIWVYRIKAVRDGITDYSITTETEFDFWEILKDSRWGEFDVNVSATYDATNTTYKIQPSLDRYYQNMLKEGDKLVVYYIRGNLAAAYFGPWTTDKSVSFSKSDLSGATITSQSFSVPNASGAANSLFIQVYLESPNRENQNISFTHVTTSILVDWEWNINNQQVLRLVIH